jgi:hypothetical protein
MDAGRAQITRRKIAPLLGFLANNLLTLAGTRFWIAGTYTILNSTIPLLADAGIAGTSVVPASTIVLIGHCGSINRRSGITDGTLFR